ncbi:MAG TPA: holo-ACP synthase [Anaerolineaceae bacterium]|nr:holo-ACP synthase [Anaerolineaceae bacterium]
MLLRTGVDLIEIRRLEELSESLRPRFYRRVFTPVELEEGGASLATLAGRFAAKEAVAKALGSGIGPISWQDIEIRRGKDGQPLLNLRGNAQRLAEELCLTTWSISISHSKTHAVAFVVALGDEAASPADQ